jgi:hypothetical protein
MPDAGDASVAAARWLETLGYSPERPAEALALAVHALLLRHGLRTRETALEVDLNRDPLPQAPAALPSDWLPTTEHAGYGTQYRHFRSALLFQIRSVPCGVDRLMVTGFATEEPDRVATLSLRISDYIRTHIWEQSRAAGSPPDWTMLVQGWQRLATLVQVDLVHTLIPDSAKDGYEARVQAQSATAGNPSTAASTGDHGAGTRSEPRSGGGPSAVPFGYRQPRPPQPQLPSSGVLPVVGDDDRLPALGPVGDWRGPSVPGLGPPFRTDDERLGGGMLMGPRHPVFRSGFEDDDDDDALHRFSDPDRDPGFPPDLRRRGERPRRMTERERLALLPPGSRVPPPPGARIDPFGPPLPSPPDGYGQGASRHRRYGDLDPPPPDTMYM